MYLHDTYFVVGHFHLIMAAAVLLASFAAIYFWFPKMFGRMMNERARQAALLADVRAAERGLHRPAAHRVRGHAAAPLRPVGVRLPASTLLPLNRGISHAAFVLGAAQLVFVWNFFCEPVRAASRRRSQSVGGRHARVDASPSPPPHHNFDAIPTCVRGPHELGHPRALARGQGLARRRTRCCRETARTVGGRVASADSTARSAWPSSWARWAMLFAALLLAYAVVRAQATAWPPPGHAAVPARRRRASTAFC